MCGGAILAELIPPTTRGVSKLPATGRAWPASSESKKGVNHKHAEVDDFEAAFENFEDDFDLLAEEENDDAHVVFASKPAFSPGNSPGLIDPVCNHEPYTNIMFMGNQTG
jgi:EREBP-like factor